MKQVKRTYYSKRKGEWITKMYNYSGKSRRGLTLVGKNGRITPNSKKNVEKFIESIKNNISYNEAEKRTLINDLKAKILSYSENGKKLTTTGFMGMQEDSKVSRYLVNLGYTSSELSDLYDIPEDAILNEDNWSGDTFTYGGILYMTQFNYTGSVLIPVI